MIPGCVTQIDLRRRLADVNELRGPRTVGGSVPLDLSHWRAQAADLWCSVWIADPWAGGPRPGAGGRDNHIPGQYPARVSDHGFWAAQSLVTEPGPASAAIDRLPSDLGALRAASQQLVFHYWADGDYAANGIEPERISEIDTRYAAAMFARLG